MLTQIDNAVLGLCTRIAHAFQHLTGRTNFFIAKLGLTLAGFSVTLEAANFIHQVLHYKTTLFVLVVDTGWILLRFRDFMQLDEADKSSSTSVERTLYQVSSYSMPIIRMLWLFFAIEDTGRAVSMLSGPKYTLIDAVASVSFSYGLTIFYYFVAVEPLKPQKSRLRQLVEKLAGAPEPVTAGAEG